MISLSDQEFDSTVAHFNAEAHAVQSGALTPDYQLTNLALGVEFQPAEHDFLGNSTDKLRSKLLADTREDSALHGCHWGRRHPHGLRRTDVARKNEVEWRQVFRSPVANVMLASSSIWRKRSSTRGCAFSISSKRSVPPKIPDSARPRSPTSSASRPINFSTDNWFWYSDISKRMGFKPSKRYAVKTFVSSVFPTPVGPTKRKEPLGRAG